MDMATLIGSPTEPLTLNAVAKISQSLAEDLRGVVFTTDGFTVEDYFSLDGNYLVEFVDGRLQVLPMPDYFHQAIVGWFYVALMHYVKPDPDSRVAFSPVRVMLDADRYREPDVAFMLAANKNRRHRAYWEGADFVLEVMSDTNRDHDWKTKRSEYANAGIPEYWIVDPDARTVTKLVLRDRAYVDDTTAREGDTLASTVLDGFSIDVGQMFRESEAAA